MSQPGKPLHAPAQLPFLQSVTCRSCDRGVRVRFRDLPHLNRTLAAHPVRDRVTPLCHIRLTAGLKVAIAEDVLHITADALGHLVREQAGIAGIAGSGWLAWQATPAPALDADARQHHALVDRVNRSLQQQDRVVILRTVGDTVIAVRMAAYACLTHAEVLQALTGHGLQRLAWAAWNRRGLDVAMYLNQPAFDLGGDPYYGGVHVRHSETGNGRLLVRGYLFRWACSNGTIFGLRHQRLFTAEPHRGTPARLVACLHQAVGAAIDHLGAAADRLRYLQITPLSPSHWRYLERRVRRRVGPAAVRRLEQQLDGMEHPTAYAAYNAVTAVARGYHGQNRLQLELLGGQFLDDSRRIGWRADRERARADRAADRLPVW